MTIRIPLSQSGPADEFAAAVEAHRAALEAQRIGEPGIEVPVVGDLIDSLIIRMPQDGHVATRGPDRFTIAPYTIFDDTLPPPSLVERKAGLMTAVYTAEQATRSAILSPSRVMLLSIDSGDAMSVPEESRTLAQQGAIDAYIAFTSRSSEISRNAALAAIEVEDLTESTIDGWKIPSL